MYRTFTKLVSFLLILFIFQNVTSKETGIDEIPVFDYVTGHFEPSKYKNFINLKNTAISCSHEMYLRKETVNALLLLLADFRKEHKNITIQIISATRNFYTQKKIWNEKWCGKRKINQIHDITKISDPILRAVKILEYSSMPGTSRHHWGTDFDLNSLNNAYFKNGEGKIIFDWLKKNAAKYGFAQPYNKERSDGYNEEKWHWSYIPLSKIFLKNWNDLYKKNPARFTQPGIFFGSEKIGFLSYSYVNSINPECK